MKIKVNGSFLDVTNGISLSEFISEKGYPGDRIVVELNGAIVRSSDWNKACLKDGDILEIVAFVGGG